MLPDSKRKIIIWCYELPSVCLINEVLGKSFHLATARDPQTILSMMTGELAPLAVLIDNAAAQGKAIETLQAVQRTRPETKRILLTDYCDLGIIVQGLHTEAIQKIVYKPLHGPELLSAIGAPSIVPLPAATSVRTAAMRAM
jgi:DNA-binding NtrC family response regulator